MKIKDYISIARPSHWFKNLFALPGILFAAFFTNIDLGSFYIQLIIGMISLCILSSANYVINEWLDAKYDAFHPTKKHRPAVLGKIRFRYLFIEYILLVISGLLLASKISYCFFLTSIIFLLMGAIYNLRPFRTKDKPYLDVLSESVNNPIRLSLGWFIVISNPLPPSSLLMGYWMAGAYLMAMKRYAECRTFNNTKVAATYRNSFKYYTEEKLLISSFFYAICSAFFLGVFLIKYKIELLLSFPLFSFLFAWYLKISMEENSAAQSPEKLFFNRRFIAYIIFMSVTVYYLMSIDIPLLNELLNNIFINNF